MLAQKMPSSNLMDLLRINMAAGEILAFAEGTSQIPEHASRPVRSVTRRSLSAPGCLLVVDDNEANRDMLCRQLERQGHTVEVAEDGAQALRLLADRQFDAILLDVLMPGMDGLEVLETIKADTKLRDLPVLMISALDELQEVAGCLQAGADDYLVKPFEPILLQARITASLERKRFRDREQERSRELERVNEELQQFAYVASHDLQEPLRTMRIYAQMLERRWRDRIDPESEQFLKFISEAAGRMSALVADVLALSRAGQQPTEPAGPVDLNDVLAQVRSNVQAAITETGAVISADSLPVVFSNPAEMIQLLQNLIGNALKYRREDVAPVITISSSRHERSWEITVEDNGIGIRPEYAETVFLPFRRLHGREIPGTGIGLALCRRIVERHGGRIWVDSARNGGSAFHFTVPVQRTSGDALS